MRFEQQRVVGDDALLHHFPRGLHLRRIHEVVHHEGLEAQLALACGLHHPTHSTGARDHPTDETEQGRDVAGVTRDRADDLDRQHVLRDVAEDHPAEVGEESVTRRDVLLLISIQKHREGAVDSHAHR